MSLALGDEDQRAGDELVAAALYKSVTAPGDNVEPLMGAAMAIARIALSFSGRDHHLCRLRARVAANHAKRFFEVELNALHLR